MSTFWYPAVAQAGVLPAIYVEPPVAQSVWSPTENLASLLEAFFSHSLSNAPLAANPAKCPVVLYQPGDGGHRRECTDKAEDLASWGYIVVGLDASDSGASVFPDGTVVGYQGGSWEAIIEGRLRDLQFVLDELGSLNAGDPRLGGRLDLDKVGVFGWSIGGSAAAQLCLRDRRCKAGVGLDGPYIETNVLTQPLGVPWLFFRSDDGPDPDPGSAVLGSIPDDRLAVYNEQVTNAYWVKLVSTIHCSFADYDLICDPGSMLGLLCGTPVTGQFLPQGRASQIVRAYLLSFFNKFLKGEDDHLLDGPSPAYPEVMEFLSK
jgi:dienelactone hydrolase